MLSWDFILGVLHKHHNSLLQKNPTVTHLVFDGLQMAFVCWTGFLHSPAFSCIFLHFSCIFLHFSCIFLHFPVFSCIFLHLCRKNTGISCVFLHLCRKMQENTGECRNPVQHTKAICKSSKTECETVRFFKSQAMVMLMKHT